jgi:hypothetical protein
MDPQLFDAMTKRVSASRSRRRVLSGLVGGVLASAGIGADAKRRGRAERKRRNRKDRESVRAAAPVCQPGGTCTTAADCCRGQTCRNGHCTGRPPLSCEQSGHCPMGERCVAGLCCAELGGVCSGNGLEPGCCSGFCRVSGANGPVSTFACCGNVGDPCTASVQCCTNNCDPVAGRCTCGEALSTNNCIDDAHCCAGLICAGRGGCCRAPGSTCDATTGGCCGNTICMNVGGKPCLPGEACTCSCVPHGAACRDTRVCCQGLSCIDGGCV